MTGNDPYKPHKRRRKIDPALVLFFVVLMHEVVFLTK